MERENDTTVDKSIDQNVPKCDICGSDLSRFQLIDVSTGETVGESWECPWAWTSQHAEMSG